MTWTKWKNHEGVRSMGNCRYNPPQPWGPWTKIMGVVARCEGNHDTCVSYDNTGMTWGYLQWTFTSGRLQKLLQSMKAICEYDFDTEEDAESEGETLFDQHFTGGGGIHFCQIFEDFGFRIEDGHFYELVNKGKVKLNPRFKDKRQRISDICMGKVMYPDSPAKQKKHAKALAEIFSKAGKDEDVAFAQIEFAKNEFKRCLNVKRNPLIPVNTIGELLDGTWDTPIPALFFNLWQNNPRAAYRLFMNEYKLTGHRDSDTFFDALWSRLSRSKFANWSYANDNKSPRIRRIKKAMREFYNLDLPLVRY